MQLRLRNVQNIEQYTWQEESWYKKQTSLEMLCNTYI